jgi:hypothetical protein
MNTFLILFLIINLIISIYSFYKCRHQAHTYGVTWWLYPLGIFVWGDGIIIGLFWAIAGLTSLFLQDFNLFLLIFSTFWLIRSLGETIFWLNQQFTTTNQYPPEQLLGHKIFRGKRNEEYDAIYFVNQVFMQIINVISLITTIYLTHQWLQNL